MRTRTRIMFQSYLAGRYLWTAVFFLCYAESSTELNIRTRVDRRVCKRRPRAKKSGQKLLHAVQLTCNQEFISIRTFRYTDFHQVILQDNRGDHLR